MDAFDILHDGFDRVSAELPDALAGLSVDVLTWQPTPQANSIGWLAWHIGRCEDAQMAVIGGTSEVYADGWAERFDLPYPATDIGYGQSAEQVRAFRVDEPQLLSDYYAAVAAATRQILSGLAPDDLDELVDDPYQVSVGVRLVSIINDITQHLGQISYLRGLLPTP